MKNFFIRIFTRIKRRIQRFIPKPVMSLYHFLWALLGMIVYQHPSRFITVIGVTGTKGKSSTIEMVNAIFEEAGYKTAVASTIHFKIDDEELPNKYKMTMPGRMFLQSFFYRAVNKKCEIAIIEMTSEGTLLHRHRFINLDALIFTNISPEHIEAHGSFENYLEAKLTIGRALISSPKRPRIMVANADDAYGNAFLNLGADVLAPFSLSAAEPYASSEEGVTFTFENTRIDLVFPGLHTIQNALAACMVARALSVKPEDMKRALAALNLIPGRSEEINEGQPFKVIVDYAHTTESLKAIYGAYPESKKICVLGNTGGGRDKWKRPEMAKIADEMCSQVILTNEDPYDEDPNQIVQDMLYGMSRKPEIIMNRREAIVRAISLAGPGDVVLLTGKGTDPYIMGREGTKEKWSDAAEARTALRARMDAARAL